MKSKHFRFIILVISLVFIFKVEYRTQTRFAVPMDYIKDLPQEYLYDIQQDNKGFIWIACEDGLIKFDGSSCIIYSNPKMSSKAGSYINFDYKNRPWYCNFDGQFFYVENDSLILADIPSNNALDFKIRADSLFYIHRDTLNVYNLRTKQNHPIAHLSETGAARFHADYFQMYMFTDKIVCYDYKGQLIQRLQFNDKIFPYLMKVGDDLIYAGQTNNSIFIKKYNGGNPILLFEFKLSTRIQNVVWHDDKIYICTKNGMLTYNLKDGKSEHYLSHISVTCYFNDDNSNEWVSGTSGLFLLPDSGKYFEYQLPNLFYRFHHIDSHLFLSDDKGSIIYFDKNKTQTQTIFQNPSKERIYDLVNLTDLENVYQLIHSDRASLFNDYFTFRGKSYFLFLPYIKSVSVLDDKYLALSTSGVVGLFKYGKDEQYSVWDKQYNTHIKQVDDSKISPLFSGIRGKQAAQNPFTNTIYFALNTGLYAVDTLTTKEILFKENKIYAKKLLTYKDRVFVLDNNGNVYILDKKNEIHLIVGWSEVYPVIDMVQHNDELVFWNIFNVYKCNLDAVHDQFTLAHCEKINTGILPNHFSTIAFDDSTLYIICKDKLITTPIHSHKLQSPPHFYFDYYQIDGLKYFDTTTIVLPTYKSNVSLKYSIVDFNQSVSDVSYRLNKGNWISVPPSERILTFDALAAGSYTLEFKINGQIQKQQIKIIVPNPWYNRWWFYLSVLTVSVLTVIFYFKHRIKVQKKESQSLLEKTNLENGLRQSLLASIKSQMNPHFLFNALNTIQSYIVTEDKENASRYLSMYSKLTRNILEMSDKEFVSLDTEINTINLYVELERMRFPDIQYYLEVQKDINTLTNFIPSMIIQPFVENSIKHGLMHKKGDKKIEIYISKTEQDLMVKICDNGIGREQSKILNKNKQHRSFATQANFKRVELLNMNRNDIVWHYNDLKDDVGNSLGTEIILTIPIKYIENDQSYNRG